MGGGTSKPDPKQEEQALLSKFIEYIKSDDYKEFEKLLELHPTILNVQDNVCVIWLFEHYIAQLLVNSLCIISFHIGWSNSCHVGL